MNKFTILDKAAYDLLSETEQRKYDNNLLEYRAAERLMDIVDNGEQINLVPPAKGAMTTPAQLKKVIRNATIIGKRNIKFGEGSGTRTDLVVAWDVMIDKTKKSYYITNVAARGELETMAINPGTIIEGINLMFDIEHGKDGQSIPTISAFANMQSEMKQLADNLLALNGPKNYVQAGAARPKAANTPASVRRESDYSGESDPEPGAYSQK